MEGDFACEPLILIVLLQVSASYIYSRGAVAAPKVNVTHTVSMQKSSTHASNEPVADAFCKRY